MAHNEEHSKRLTQISVAAFCTIMLLCIVASIHLSTAELSFGTQVYGSHQVLAGQNAGFRVMIVNTHNLRPLAFDHAKLQLKAKKDVLFKQAYKNQEVANIHIPIPADAPTELTLEFDIEASGNSDHFTIPLKVMKKPGPLEMTLLKSPSAQSKSQKDAAMDQIAIHLYPETGKIVSAFKNRLRIYVTKNGQPWRTKLEIPLLEKSVSTDEQGFATLIYKPMAHLKKLTFAYTLDHKPQTLKVPIQVEALQMQVDFKGRRIIPPGQTQEISISKLPFSTPLHLDLWLGNALVQVASYRQRRGPIELNMEIPELIHQPIRWQFFRNLMAPQGSDLNYVQWLSHHTGTKGQEAALNFLQDLPGDDILLKNSPTHTSAMLETRHQALMGRLQPYHPGTPLLHSSTAGRKTELEAWRNNLRQIVHRIFLISALLGGLLLIISLWRHHRTTQAQMKAALDEGFLAGEAVDPRLSHTYPKDRKLDLLMAMIAIFSLIYAIYILLTHIQWRY
ncbi:MAG: hypothetical protein QGI45_08910 [Myxococcota bacterium]|nr:hypothetical protein [Myxococcota bacterium]